MSKTYDTDLSAKIAARNEVNALANASFADAIEALRPFVGQKVCKVDGSLLEKVKRALPPAISANGSEAYSWYSTGHGYSLVLNVKTVALAKGKNWTPSNQSKLLSVKLAKRLSTPTKLNVKPSQRFTISACTTRKDQTMTTTEDFETALKTWLDGAQHLLDEDHKRRITPTYTPTRSTIEIERGKRYIRVIQAEGTISRSAYAFIDTNGDVLKPASWKTPAKHARGNIFDEHNGLRFMSCYGPAYLR